MGIKSIATAFKGCMWHDTFMPAEQIKFSGSELAIVTITSLMVRSCAHPRPIRIAMHAVCVLSHLLVSNFLHFPL